MGLVWILCTRRVYSCYLTSFCHLISPCRPTAADIHAIGESLKFIHDKTVHYETHINTHFCTIALSAQLLNGLKRMWWKPTQTLVSSSESDWLHPTSFAQCGQEPLGSPSHPPNSRAHPTLPKVNVSYSFGNSTDLSIFNTCLM